MSTAQDTIGKLIDESQQRDAVHVALAPMRAPRTLKPGEHYALDDKSTPVGIVDPFLRKTVQTGEWFWLFLYPNTVTGMRHEWQHPAFAPAQHDASKGASEQWLRDWLSNSEAASLTYDEFLRLAHGEDQTKPDDDYGRVGWSHEGDYLLRIGSDAYGEIPNEVWDHVEIVTGRPVAHRAIHFSCSC